MKLYKLLFLILLFTYNLFAQSVREDLDGFFEDEYFLTTNEQLKCEPTCRTLSYPDKYMAKKVDFDATTGVTTCEVYEKSSGNNLRGKSINANTQLEACLDEYNDLKVDYTSSNLKSKQFTDSKNIDATIEDYSKNIITMSRFIAGLATLDGDIIDIVNSKSGTIQKSDSTSMDMVYNLNSSKAEEKDTLLNTVDELSTKNLSYYVDLFYSMDKIYEYMVAYVFVFISLFFMIMYASKIALKKIAKKTTAFDEPWQTKVSIIVFSTVIFFIPMKLDNEYSSTLFQNIWKYFVEESSSIADKANNIGMQTYMKKVYNTTGASGVETEANLVLVQKQQELLKTTYKNALEECKDRYPNQLSYQETDLERIKDIEDFKGEDSVGEQITLRGCRAIEKRYRIAYTIHKQVSHTLSRIENSYTNTDLPDRLATMTEHMNNRVKELGWYSSILAPTLQVLTKISFLQGNDDIDTINDVNDEYRAKINAATEERIGIKESEAKAGETLSKILDSQISESENNNTKQTLGEILAQTSFLSFVPGASTLYNYFEKLGGKNITALLKELAADKNTAMVAGLSGQTKTLAFTSTITKFIIELLPFITTFIAVGIVIILYLYELIVFSFVSPFIVAFAVTTGQARKILDFLVTALTIFLKPTIIVISIYLALFLYSIFQDIFVLMADEQFYLSMSSNADFMPSFIFNFVKQILFIFAAFASVFFMWKLIMQMPDFIYRLVGLDKLNSTSQMAGSMQQSFGKFGFSA